MRLSVHIYPSTIQHETRILKVTRAMLDSGVADRILVVGMSKAGQPEQETIDDKREVMRIKASSGATLPIGKAVRIVNWARHVYARLRTEKIAFVNCHSLSALPLCVAVAASHKATLIYEPHELATQTATFEGAGWSRMASWLEGRLIRKAARVTVVSDSIAEYYRTHYNREIIVVRNTPRLDSSAQLTPNRVLRDRFAIPDGEMIFMYQGLLQERRGVRWLLEAFERAPPDRHVVFMGFGELEEAVKQAAAARPNVHFLPAVPQADIQRYTRGADVGVALLFDDCTNHRYALPNKFFHYLHAGMPVIASDLKEMGSIVDRYACGWKVGAGAPALADCIARITPADVIRKAEGARQARQGLHWGDDAARLIAMYQGLTSAPSIVATAPHRVCTRCVMDTTVPDITFDADGRCNYCTFALDRLAREHYASAATDGRLEQLVADIRGAGKGRPYDCIIGVSGGLDSSYVAYLVKHQLGLRPLAVHFDNGWDSELAVQNIERLLKKLDIDLQTKVVDWEEFRDLQLAFLRSGLVNSEIPTDHAILALLYGTAAQHGVKYILHGGNLATESIMPRTWMEDAKDLRLIRAVHAKYGTRALKTFPSMSLRRLAYLTFVRKIRYVGLLNYFVYSRADAMRTLSAETSWRAYASKHFESIFTRFFQGYLLPQKFGYDKRRPHLSSLIVSGQMTHDEALTELMSPPYDPVQAAEDAAYIRQKFRLSQQEFDDIMRPPLSAPPAYPNSDWVFRLMAPAVKHAKAVASLRTRHP